MHGLTKNRIARIIVVALILLVTGQVFAVESTGHTPSLPQWAKDRQQYERGYIYVRPARVTLPSKIAPAVPEWVKDRQQYEPNYTYMPQQSGVFARPAWVKDRQQYEPGYVYQAAMP